MSAIPQENQAIASLGVLPPNTVVTEARLTAVINQVVIPAIDAIPELVRQQLQPNFDRIDEKFRQIDTRFEQVDEKFRQIDKRFDSLEARMERGFSTVNKRIDVLAADMHRKIRLNSVDHQIRIATAKKELGKRMRFIEKKQQMRDEVLYGKPHKKTSVYATGVADAEFDVIVGKDEKSIQEKT